MTGRSLFFMEYTPVPRCTHLCTSVGCLFIIFLEEAWGVSFRVKCEMDTAVSRASLRLEDFVLKASEVSKKSSYFQVELGSKT